MNSILNQFIWWAIGAYVAPAAAGVFALALVVYIYRIIRKFV